MDLPKGFVKDDRRIYGDIASLSQPLPSDFIIRMWRLYTTTNLKLVDPTARRLENFWWQVMGSDRCNLRADTLAKIWEHISYGPTFVPLKGSPNRWEGPTTPRFNSQHESDVLYNAQQSTQDVKRITDQSSIKELSASSSRPPPPHPILKKSRGDSKSGPRPTARFVSPHDSADEDFKTSEETSSGSTAASGLEMRTSTMASPARLNKKKPSTPTKRFVASAANKRRPVLPRRLSSQSSTNSDIMAKDVGSANGTKHIGSYNVVHPQADQATVQDLSVSEGMEPPPSAKALGKRPANRTNLEKSNPLKSPPIIEERQKPVIVQTTNRAPAPPPLDKSAMEKPVQETTRVRQEGPKTPSYAPLSSPALSSPRIGSFSSSRSVFSTPRMERTSSNSETYRPREASIGRGPSQLGLLSGATAKTSTVAAVGHVSISGEPDKRALEALGSFREDTAPKGTPRRTSSSSHFTPTMPSATPEVPLARTRSQLTLLLEREKERLGERPRQRS